MARQLVSRLTFVLALTSALAFVGCAEEPAAPVTTPEATTPATPPAEPAKTEPAKTEPAATPPVEAPK